MVEEEGEAGLLPLEGQLGGALIRQWRWRANSSCEYRSRVAYQSKNCYEQRASIIIMNRNRVSSEMDEYQNDDWLSEKIMMPGKLALRGWSVKDKEGGECGGVGWRGASGRRGASSPTHQRPSLPRVHEGGPGGAREGARIGAPFAIPSAEPRRFATYIH